MALFSSILRQLFERFAHFLRRRETPQRPQQCAAQELAALKLPEAPLTKAGESEAFQTAKNKKHRKRRRQYKKKEEERQVKRKVKKEREMNEGGSNKDKAKKERQTLSLEKIKVQVKIEESVKFKEMQSLENLMDGESEHREAGEKRRKKRKLKDRESTGSTPLLVEVKPQPSPVSPPVRPSFLEPIEGEIPVLASVSEHFALSAPRFKPLPPVTKPSMCPLALEEVTLPGLPIQVDLPSVSEHFDLPAACFKSLPPVINWPRHPQKPAAPAPAHLVLPAARFKPLLPPQKPAPAPEEFILPGTPLVDPPKLLVPPRPTPARDELFSFRCSQVSPPKRLVVPPSSMSASDEVVALQHSSIKECTSCLVKPQLSTSLLFEPPPQLILVDMEDEENEYVEYTGKTIRLCDLPKAERPQAEINPRMAAWLENDSKVLEEVWESEVVEVQEFEKEKDDSIEIGDSKAIQGHLDDAYQKKKEMDEHMTKLFCVTSPEHPKNETQPQEESQTKRKVSLFLFTWADEKAKKKEEKKIRKEKERRDKKLLLERYRNDPNLKHLLINKHNRHYSSS